MQESQVITVTQLSIQLKQFVESSFGILKVRGEISGLKRHTSGHTYFSLKDSDSLINAICWRGTKCAEGLNEGLEIICIAKITTYSAQSRYQLVVIDFQPAGQGALLKMLEDRKKRLTAEGVFDPSKKKPLPFIPQVIGVVTSPTGAVIKDISHRISARFPVRIVLWPTVVQGEGAASQIVAAIKGFNNIGGGCGAVPRPDVIIVARGGGSLEDLMPFNDEAVVRAAAASKIPLISAIGHETDTTLIDYAADIRAPTPTAAAEMAVPVKNDLLLNIWDLKKRLLSGLQRMVKYKDEALSYLVKRFPASWQITGFLAQKLDYLSDNIKSTIVSFCEKQGYQLIKICAEFFARTPDTHLLKRTVIDAYNKLSTLFNEEITKKNFCFTRYSELLDSFSYKKTLERGFAVVSDDKGGVITRKDAALRSHNGLVVTFKDGAVFASSVSGNRAEKVT